MRLNKAQRLCCTRVQSVSGKRRASARHLQSTSPLSIEDIHIDFNQVKGSLQTHTLKDTRNLQTLTCPFPTGAHNWR
ncbi:hypothetical protein DPX16_1818 [Anabarilius grahami]|uniref:Uncharacterized protein n=1 Tax=Anabarilius grahami TaxID=495550 RepID=A0A3N0Y6U4_ANAGA|nr:hypothetical protein DPX16_1818 [Anabarilius grahami]